MSGTAVSHRTPTPRERAADALLWLFLVSPVLLDPLMPRSAPSQDPQYLLSAALSLGWLVLVRSLGLRALWLHLAMLPFYLTTAADLYVLWTFGNRLSAGYLGIVMSDHTEVWPFLLAHWQPVVMVAALLAGVLMLGLPGVRTLRYPRRPLATAAAALWLTLSYTSVFGAGVWVDGGVTKSAWNTAGKDLSAPYGVLSQAALAGRLFLTHGDALRARAEHQVQARKSTDWGREIHVLVIGESSRAANWSLMGYTARDTTPRLRAAEGVQPLPHAWATAAHTAYAVPSMLSLAPVHDWNAVLSQRSVISAFAAAQFKTHWFSTQKADVWVGIIPRVAAEAKQRRFFDRQYDGVLLRELAAAIEASGPNDKLLVVLHTQGSHWSYADRYPAGFDRFKPDAPGRRAQLIATYDNSIAYTDWLLAEAIGLLERSGAHAALYYASDHGENLLDDERALFGHAQGTEHELQTAAMVWLSPALRANRPEAARQLAANARKPSSLAQLSHSMIGLAGIEVAGYDPTQDLFDARFTPRRRAYIVRGDLRWEQDRTTVPTVAARGAVAPAP